MRLLLAFLLILALAGAASGQRPAEKASSEWPQFRGNPRLTGVAGSAPTKSLKLLWTYESGDSIDSSAAIVDGVVHVGLGNGELIALNLSDGAVRWKYSTMSFIGESSPAVSSGVVFIGDLDGTLHAVNARDGKLLWAYKTEGEIKSSPVVVDGLVLIGSYDTFLYALDARSGELRWRFQTGGPVHSTPAVQDGLVFVAGCDEVFRAIRVADGEQAYEIPAGGYTAASPVLDGDRAYFGTFSNEVISLNLNEKAVSWRYSDPQQQFPFYSSAALTGSRVIVGGRDKLVHAIDAATGKAAWTFAARARIDASPVVAGDRVFVGSYDGRLYVLDIETGNKQWEFNAGAALAASPAIASGRVIVASRDGVLYCFG
jgi:outer membrane protein assembly factor BamB